MFYSIASNMMTATYIKSVKVKVTEREIDRSNVDI